MLFNSFFTRQLSDEYLFIDDLLAFITLECIPVGKREVQLSDYFNNIPNSIISLTRARSFSEPGNPNGVLING